MNKKHVDAGFCPKTKIWTISSSGKLFQKEIQFIEIGNKVLTSSGKIRKVVNKFQYDYIGEIYILNNDVFVTPQQNFHSFNKLSHIKEHKKIKDINDSVESLITIDGKTENIQIDIEAYQGKIYNFEIDNDHSYCVGDKCFQTFE